MTRVAVVVFTALTVFAGWLTFSDVGLVESGVKQVRQGSVQPGARGLRGGYRRGK